jgi:hypothetical protein
MDVHLPYAAQKPVRVTVIMSSDQGVLVFQSDYPQARSYPWDRISWMGSAPAHDGMSQSLRDWLHTARDCIRGIPATVLGWMGWPAAATVAPQVKQDPPASRPKQR